MQGNTLCNSFIQVSMSLPSCRKHTMRGTTALHSFLMQPVLIGTNQLCSITFSLSDTPCKSLVLRRFSNGSTHSLVRPYKVIYVQQTSPLCPPWNSGVTNKKKTNAKRCSQQFCYSKFIEGKRGGGSGETWAAPRHPARTGKPCCPSY